MGNRRMIRSMRLGIYFFVIMIWAGPLAAQDPAAAVEPMVITVGGTEIRLMPPEAPLERMDESDKKVRTALEVFWAGEESLVLGVYAEAAAWRQFAKSLSKNGLPAPTLDFYALASTPEALLDAGYGPDDFLIFKKAVLQVNQGIQVIENLPRALTFKAILNPVQGGNAAPGLIRVITSVILVEGKVIYLTVFDNDNNKHRDQTPTLALAWRDACLAANRP